MTLQQTPPPYVLYEPKTGLSPFVFAVPHSGRFYPPDFVSRAKQKGPALRRSEDAFVDDLFKRVPDFGGSLLVATHARAYLDLNRAGNELDPAMFTPRLEPNSVNLSQRVKAGLGLIPGFVAEGKPLYSGPLPAREAEKRRSEIHTPYHACLKKLLEQRRERFGVAYLIDCHSMPSEAGSRRRGSAPHIVLGDSWGSACDRDITSLAEELFIGAGFQVRRNVPYSGGYTTVHYGKPRTNIHALQIEINRAVYMNEAKHEPLAEFGSVHEAITRVSQQLIETTVRRLATKTGSSIPRAAE